MLKILPAVALIAALPALADDPYPSTYEPPAAPPTLFEGATVLTGTGERLDDTDVYVADGMIRWIGAGEVAADASVVDASDHWLTPGIIDVHSHLGVYPSPGVEAHSDGNEMTAPVTAEVWAEHSIWPQDPGFVRALAGGVTTLQVLPGSANLFGGRGVTIKNSLSGSYQGMKFPGAPHGLKMACGENPKRVYGSRNSAPSTRMGNVAAYREAWIRARRYIDDWAEYEASEKDDKTAPARDLELETLAGALKGEIIVHMHCYRADEMMTVLDMADEFGYRVGSFHHGVEAYKIADRLAEEGVCGALWADWWGFKMEAYDGIMENIAIVDRPDGGCAVVHSDSAEGIQRLNQEAAKAMARGQRVGMDIPPERAIRWITGNAAKSLGIDDVTGTIEVGKMADLVLWDRNPLSVYAHAEKVYIDGVQRFDRADPELQPVTDFELGQLQGASR